MRPQMRGALDRGQICAMEKWPTGRVREHWRKGSACPAVKRLEKNPTGPRGGSFLRPKPR